MRREFYPTVELDLSYNTRNDYIKNIAIFKDFLYFVLLSLKFEIPLEHNWYLNLQLYRSVNSPSIAHFKFSKVALINQI